MSDTGRAKFGLIHGTGHGAWSWELLQPELAARGIDSIAMDLPIDRLDATYDDYAAVASLVLEQETKDGSGIDLIVAHSGGGQAVPGVFRRLGKKIGGIVYLSASLGDPDRDNTGVDLTSVLFQGIPRQRNSPEFRRANLPLEDGRTVVDPAQVEDLFFNDCKLKPEVVLWAMKRIRPQVKPKDEPPLSAHILNGIPRWYLLGKEDRIRDREWAIRAAGSLGMTFVEIEGGHSPAISRPVELAELLKGLLDRISNPEDTAPMPALGNGLLRQTA